MHPTFPRDTHSIAHVSLVCFPVLACLLVLSSCGPSAAGTASLGTTGTPTSALRGSPVTAPAGTSVLFQQIHMVTASTGWALADEASHGRILRTTGGVTHWQDVTPAVGSAQAIIGGTAFFDLVHAWVLVGMSRSWLVYRTHDGGQTWQQAQIPVPGRSSGYGQLFFLNAQLGWILLSEGGGSGVEAVDVLHTRDGGASWKLLSVSNETTIHNPLALPFDGNKGGLSFVNETTGWVSGGARDHFPWLYVTHDAGVTWRHQAIPFPAQATGVVTFLPLFFGATDSFLPANTFSPEGQAVEIDVTHDSGTSWSALPLVPASADAGTIEFLDALHGWIASNSLDVRSKQYRSTVYSTSDGGEHWRQHSVTLSADILLIDFASPTQGWAIDGLQILYQTTDSGQTWSKVMPSVA